MVAADPDLQIRWGGGGHPHPEITGSPVSKKFFSAFFGPLGFRNLWHTGP